MILRVSVCPESALIGVSDLHTGLFAVRAELLLDGGEEGVGGKVTLTYAMESPRARVMKECLATVDSATGSFVLYGVDHTGALAVERVKTGGAFNWLEQVCAFDVHQGQCTRLRLVQFTHSAVSGFVSESQVSSSSSRVLLVASASGALTVLAPITPSEYHSLTAIEHQMVELGLCPSLTGASIPVHETATDKHRLIMIVMLLLGISSTLACAQGSV